jgi:hypothetical protein
MPSFTIDAPEGAPPTAKQTMLREISDALDDAYHIHDIRGWVREYSEQNMSQDGRIGAQLVRPVCVLEGPELVSLDVKRKLMQKIKSAIANAYLGIANTDDVVVLINEHPLHNVG